MRLHQGPLVFRLFFDEFDACDECKGSRRVQLGAVVGTTGGAVHHSMSRLSAAEAEILFMGELLCCLIEVRYSRGCVCFRGGLDRGTRRGKRGAGKGSSGSVGARGVGFTRVRVVELIEVLLKPACAFNELGQYRGGP